MLSLLICYDNVITSVYIQYTRGTHCNTILMKMKQKVVVNPTNQ